MTTKKLIQEAKARLFEGIGVPEQETFVMDDFQREAIEGVCSGNDVLVVAPTGSGKTFIATDAIRRTLERGDRAVYTTPLKALSNTKYNDFKRLYEPHHKVGILTGDRKIEGDASVVIATTEIYRNELYQESFRYSLVILDEVHFLSDPQRGPVWEESIILTPTTSSILMLSASISNAVEVAEWIESVRGKPCKVVIKQDRPVELRFGFLHPDYGAIPLRDEKGKIFSEVLKFYGSTGLDSSGMRVGNRDRGSSQGQRRGGRGQRQRRGRR